MIRPTTRWLVHPPVAHDPGTGRWDGEIPEWLVQLRRFRAEVLYADGLRPGYRAADGTFRDEDPCDPFAYHVVALTDGAPTATLRIVPLGETSSGVCERLLGTDAVDKALAELGVDRSEACEASGWAVHAKRRRLGLGVRSLAAASAVTGALRLRIMLGAVGVHYGALNRVLSVGLQRVPGFPPVAVPALVDEVQLVHMTFDKLRPSFRARVERLAELLQWDERSSERVNELTP
jgi:hypothetical protein